MAAVVVTGGKLAPAAMALLQHHQIAVELGPPYLDPAALARLVAEAAADAIIVRTGRITAEVIVASPRLRLIAKHGTGVDGIDLAAAAARRIPVVRAPGANAQSAAEHTIALMLAVTKQVPALDARVRAGEWPKTSHLGLELAGKRLGLVGFGAIGQRVATCAAALGMEVGYIRRPGSPAADTPIARAHSSLVALLGGSDIVSLHCPLTVETERLIDRRALELMKPTAFLINTARGGLIDEEALAEALDCRRLAGAGLDCLVQEPPPPGHPFFRRPEIILSPHIAGATVEAFERMGLAVARQVVAALRDEPLDRALLVSMPV